MASAMRLDKNARRNNRVDEVTNSASPVNGTREKALNSENREGQREGEFKNRVKCDAPCYRSG